MKKFILTKGNFRFDEYFGELKNLSYFRMGGSHGYFLGSEIKGPAIFCYSEISGFLRFLEENCLSCPNKSNFSYRISRVPSYFFDWKDDNKILEFSPSCQVFVNNKPAGIACRKLKILHLTDWTHTSEGAKFLDDFIEKVIVPEWRLKSLSLRPVNASIMLGVDVEFEELSSFEEYIPTSTTISGGLDDEIGRDGAGDQIELRPRPSKKPSELIREIKRLLNQINDVPLSWVGDRFPLGAHVHIGLPVELKNKANYQILSQFLDELIGKYVLDLSGRARGRYKVLTAWESKPWGFEYRSMPSYVFATPRLAYLILKLIKRGIQDFIRKGEIELSGDWGDWLRYLSVKEVLELKSFLDNQDKVHFLINKNWKVKESLRLGFYDDWSYEVKKFVEDLFLKKEKIFLKHKIYKIVLFGFKESRGLVSNIPLKGCSIIQEKKFNPISEKETLRVGFPYKFRTSGLTEEIKEIWKIWIEDIVNFVKGVI